MKPRPVRLDRNTVVELFGRLFRIVQGLAGSSEFNWAAFKRYYDAEKVAEVRSILERIRQLLPPEAATIEEAKRPACISPDYKCSLGRLLLLGVAGPFLVYCWPILNGLRSSWSFPSQELAYILNRLQTFLELLQVPGHPGYDKVVPLRMDLHACQWLVESRCHGVRELKKVLLTEHFNMAPHIKTIPLSAIIKPAATPAA